MNPPPPAPSLPRPTTPHARRSGDHRAAAVTQPPLLSLQRSLFPVLPPTCPSAVLPADRILHLNPTLGPVRGHVVPLPVSSPRRPPSPPPPSTRYLARPSPRPGTQGKRISLQPRPAPGESCLRRSRAPRLTDSRRALAQSSGNITSSSPRPPQPAQISPHSKQRRRNSNTSCASVKLSISSRVLRSPSALADDTLLLHFPSHSLPHGPTFRSCDPRSY
ncbi:hypothetical protein V8E36_005734 [Tilletia maclaganii]